ncbi:MAG: class I SAM-dependent methyltransferase [Acidimicrobiia bacterium]
MPIDERRAVNLANWEDRVAVHAGPEGYDLAAFDEPGHISDVVRFDVPRLGDVTGLDVVHLQCHIGTDTVSLARLGATSVTGYDFSPSAIAEARRLAVRAEVDAHTTFVEGELYDAIDVLGPERFDLVYTGVGALCWLPDIEHWARVVAGLLRPGGRLHLREGHPVVWTLSDPRPDGELVIEFPYFEAGGATRFDEPVTYAGDGTLLAHPTIWSWNHGIGEILTAVADAGLVLTAFEEHDTLPWNPLADEFEAVPPFGEFRLVDRPSRLPCSYTLRARKPA